MRSFFSAATTTGWIAILNNGRHHSARGRRRPDERRLLVAYLSAALSLSRQFFFFADEFRRKRSKNRLGHELGLAGGRGGEPGGPRPSPVVLATPTTRDRGSKGRSYINLISFDPYRTPVFILKVNFSFTLWWSLLSLVGCFWGREFDTDQTKSDKCRNGPLSHGHVL